MTLGLLKHHPVSSFDAENDIDAFQFEPCFVFFGLHPYMKGYGCIHLPICGGQYVRQVPLYKPLSASAMQQMISWAAGRPAEFSNPRFPAMGEGREVTRVKSTGAATLHLNIVTKDMGLFGYSEAPGTAGEPALPGGKRVY